MRSLVPLLATLGLAVATPPAEATTLAPLSIEQMTDASDFVVRGTVTEVWTERDSSGFIWTKAAIAVDTSLKNTAPAELVVESPGGRYDGAISEVRYAARYSVGEELIAFVAEKAPGRFGTVGMAAGKYTVRIDPADGSEMLVRFTIPYTQSYDARFIPNPAPALRTSLASFEAQVRARAAAGWDGSPIPGVSAEHLRSINKLQPGVK